MTTYVQSECGLSVKAQEILTVLKAVSGDPRTEGFLEEYKGRKWLPMCNILNGHLVAPDEYKVLLDKLSSLVIKDILDVCVSIDPSGHYCLAQTANRLDDGRFLMLKYVNPNNNKLDTKFYVLYSCQEHTYILGDTEKTVFAKAYMLTGDLVLSYGESKVSTELMVDTADKD